MIFRDYWDLWDFLIYREIQRDILIFLLIPAIFLWVSEIPKIPKISIDFLDFQRILRFLRFLPISAEDAELHRRNSPPPLLASIRSLQVNPNANNPSFQGMLIREEDDYSFLHQFVEDNHSVYESCITLFLNAHNVLDHEGKSLLLFYEIRNTNGIFDRSVDPKALAPRKHKAFRCSHQAATSYSIIISVTIW